MLVGLIASCHTIIYASRQVHSRSSGGYFPRGLSITHGTHQVPHYALLIGAVVGFVVMMVIFIVQTEQSGAIIGGILLNMAVVGAGISYLMQGLSFVVLRQKLPHIPRPYVSPLGNAGGYIVMVIAAVTLIMQLQDPVYRNDVYFAAA